MPCDTIRTVSLKLKADSVDSELLKGTVEKLGHRNVRVTESGVSWDTGYYDRESEEIVERNNVSANAIRQSYAQRLVEKNLNRFGWQVQQRSTKQG